VCNHPYLFQGVEPTDAPMFGDHIINVASKLKIVDRLLPRIFAKQSKVNIKILLFNYFQVIIFSQMRKVLDILDDYLTMKEINFCRIDGGTTYEERETQMDAFNDINNPDLKVFLLTTRAGGLGITLTGADTVIIYDR
jgi:SWI/SNF-related matrix-associated actin-dependent regulator of chromatin subfamily A member 5